MKSNCLNKWLTLLASLCLVLGSANAQQPPSTDRVLWLKADAGTTLGANLAVTKWADQAGGVLNDGTPYGATAPHLGEIAFSNGLQPAILFNGQGFLLANPTDLDLTNLSIYVVGSISQPQSSSIMISSYAPVSGWALGIADYVQNRVKWFSAGTSQSGTEEPAGADLTVDTPAIITATFSNDTKELYLNSTLMESETGQQSPNYFNGHQLTVGTLSGGSQLFAGAIAELLVYSSASDSQRNAVEQYLRRKYFGTGTGPAAITSQPSSQTVNAANSAAFAVAVDGTPPISFQWRKNDVAIPGATNIDYLISNVTTNDAASYTVVVSNSVGGSVLSGPAVLTVNSDLTPPQVSAAGRDFAVTTTAVVTFSEVVAAATATNANNYKINNGVTVASAAMDGATSVVLTTSAINYGPAYTLTVTNVEDLAGNKIAPNTTIALQVLAPIAVQPPATDMVLWLKADGGVTTDTDGVLITGWTDQAAGGNDNSSQDIVGTPKLKEAAFTYGGFHQVVRLDGLSGFHLLNASDADLPEFSIYVVGSVANNNQGSEIFVSDWPGMAFGISDTVGGVPKFVTYNGGVNSLEPAAAKLSNAIPAELGMTFSTGSGTKVAYFNGAQVAQANNLTISYGGGALTVGMLFATGGQNLNGDIAEILVYSSVSNEQRAAVEDYLAQKYFGGHLDHIPPTLNSAQRDMFQTTVVAVQFSEPVSTATAMNVTNYVLDQGGMVSGASLNSNGTTVVLTTTPLSGTVTNVLTVNNVQDVSGNLIATNSQVTIAVPSDPIRAQYSLGGTNNLLVLEAEHYSLNTPAGGITWNFTTAPPLLSPTDVNTNFSGDGAMLANPNTGVNTGTPALGTAPAGSPRLDFKVRFTAAGTYSVWVRGVGDGSPGAGANDSVLVGLDGALTTRLTGFPQGQGYAWGNTPIGDSGPITISTPGLHVINVWMREDGFAIDKLLLTSDSGFAPTDLGPAESSVISPFAITIARSGANVTLTWPGGGSLQSSTNVTGPYTDIIGASSPFSVPPTGAQNFYRVRQ